MLYQRFREIEQRLRTVLRLIRRGRYSTPKLADRIGVSVPTMSRYVTALRERGYEIRAEKQAKEWRYVLVGKSSVNRRTASAATPYPSGVTGQAASMETK